MTPAQCPICDEGQTCLDVGGITVHVSARVPSGHIGFIGARNYGKTAAAKILLDAQAQFEVEQIGLTESTVRYRMLINGLENKQSGE